MDQGKKEGLERFLNALFRPQEATCFARQKKGTSVFPVSAPPWWAEFFSLNPLHPTEDQSGNAEPGRGRRNDDNVTAYRNILIEVDDRPLDEQLVMVENIAFPWTTCVFSGKKSYHFIVALEESLVDRKQYDFYVTWIYSIFHGIIDPANKNPSRLTRLPGTIRRDTGQEQRLIEIRERRTLAQLDAWLQDFPDFRPLPAEESVPLPPELTEGELGFPSRATKKFLTQGTDHGFQNSSLYKAAKDLQQQGWDEERATPLLLEPLKNTPEFNEELSRHTIRMAFKKPPRHPKRLG
jgi:hypothetical protein